MAQQQEELRGLAELRETRKAQMQKDQRELMKHCRFTGNKGRDLIRRFFNQQYQEWLKNEQDDLDRLKFAHQEEMGALTEKQAKRDNIVSFLSSNFGHESARNRGR